MTVKARQYKAAVLSYSKAMTRAENSRTFSLSAANRSLALVRLDRHGEALEDISLALEAGYRHWPEDISQTDTPLEAGMDWVCSKTKEFRGGARLRERRGEEERRRLVCLTVESGSGALVSAPILCNGRTVGYVRRTATGEV